MRIAMCGATLLLSLASAAYALAPVDCAHPPHSKAARDHYPHGSDLVSCHKPNAQTEEWKIFRPDVSHRANSYAIPFRAGDVITLGASGCAQGGGSGATWRRYVEPLEHGLGLTVVNDNSHAGLVEISGVTPGLSTIGHWINVPIIVTRDTSLVLGFDDDDYSDNGYSDHDDGVGDQCKGSKDASVTVRIQRGAAAAQLVCSKSNPPFAAPAAEVAEFSQLKGLLKAAEISLGNAVSTDASAAGLIHFQHFRDPNQDVRYGNRSVNSVEMHSDGCMYVAYTDIQSPYWYPVDYGFDQGPRQPPIVRPWDPDPKGRVARPWDPLIKLSYFDLEHRNRTRFATTVDGLGEVFPNPAHLNWGASSLPAECGGPAGPGRAPAPRWLKICAPKGVAPAQWTADSLSDLKQIAATVPALKHSGAVCHWMRAAGPTLSNDLAPCDDTHADEWVPVKDEAPRDAEGVIVASFMSGQDASINHEAKPDSAWLGTYADLDLHNIGVQNCGTRPTITLEDPDYCLDWEANLQVDPNYRRLLAVNERALRNTDHADPRAVCTGDTEYRLGNWAPDMMGNLGLEIEQWNLPVGYRPEAGDRALVSGRWIVDCGHVNWQSELHPLRLITSSHLQTGPSLPTVGLTRNLPLVAGKWAELTGGKPAALTKVVVTGYWIDNQIEFDVWPPPRPSAASQLAWSREKPTSSHAIEHAQIQHEVDLPIDNPNHVHVIVHRDHPGRAVDKRSRGQVKPDDDTRVVTAYLLWWK